ncbi:MAG: hypothetical protein QM671_19775 [Bacillus sp. (in: firmicutes)]|uniref:hypothetical protein n=1 Tax=Bacillus sp. TaxID=1409 RepID=UPI0039E55D53
MLKKLKNQNQLSAGKIQNEIARIKNLKVELDKSVMDVFKYADDGINLLDNKAEHITLISQITNIKEKINIDLDTIKKFPDMITIDAWRIFDSIHKKVTWYYMMVYKMYYRYLKKGRKYPLKHSVLLFF